MLLPVAAKDKEYHVNIRALEKKLENWNLIRNSLLWIKLKILIFLQEKEKKSVLLIFFWAATNEKITSLIRMKKATRKKNIYTHTLELRKAMKKLYT